MHLLSKEHIVKWYESNCDTRLSCGLIDYMVGMGLLEERENLIDLVKVNELLLVSYGNEFIVNDDDKFIVKDNKKGIIDSFGKPMPMASSEEIKVQVPTEKKNKTPKFVIEHMGGNKLKLKRL